MGKVYAWHQQVVAVAFFVCHHCNSCKVVIKVI